MPAIFATAYHSLGRLKRAGQERVLVNRLNRLGCELRVDARRTEEDELFDASHRFLNLPQHRPTVQHLDCSKVKDVNKDQSLHAHTRRSVPGPPQTDVSERYTNNNCTFWCFRQALTSANMPKS